MAQYKAMPLVVMRRSIRERSPDVEQALRDALGPDERAIYDTLVATAWIPLQLADRLYAVGAPLLYPSDPSPLQRVGRDLARENLSGVYRFVVRMLSVPTLVEKAATLWRNFHDTGVASIAHASPTSACFEVREHPTLPPHLRETVSGWIAQAVEMTGAQNVRVIAEGDPACWTWSITWR